jgi:hypothetical protein
MWNKVQKKKKLEVVVKNNYLMPNRLLACASIFRQSRHQNITLRFK